LAGSAAFDLDYPTSVSIPLTFDGKWLHARGLYVDYLETEAVDAIVAAREDVTCNTAQISPPKTAAEVLKECILKLLPFTSINLSELADWDPLSGVLTVTNADYYKSSTDPSPVRGKVKSSALSASNVNGTAKSRSSNSALLDLSFEAISAVDAQYLTDSQTFAIGGGAAATSEGNGTFRVTITQPTGYTGTFGVNSLVPTKTNETCNLDTSTAATYDYLCPVTKGLVGLGLNYAGSPGMSVIVSGYNASAPGTQTTAMSCTYAGPNPGTFTGTPKSSGTTAYAINKCYNYKVQTSPLAKNVTRNENAMSPYTAGGNAGESNETTTIGFTRIDSGTPDPAVNIGDNIQIIFEPDPETSPTINAPATCTFTCQQEQGNDCKANKAIYFSFATPAACP
jgi:hypothetical protein